MTKQSAGIMVYRRNGTMIEVLLVHPGGPFWAKKDAGAWSVPKGEVEADEDLIRAAQREFREETGQAAPEGTYIELGSFKRGSGKMVTAWAVEGTIDATNIHSNTTSIEWPPKSGTQLEIPEVDRARWFTLDKASAKMHKGQDVFIKRLAEKLHVELVEPPQQQTLL
jgi:predicted NUDIX family NTP pyrophosphohydrolase